MNRKKRSTVVGAALIFIGVLAGVLLCRRAVGDTPYRKHPQGGLSKPTTAVQAGPAPTQLAFSSRDAALASIRYADDCPYRPNVTALVQQALQWDLTVQEPSVLIVHTHGSESYTKSPGQDYRESSDYRTLDTNYNVVALGDQLAESLQRAGISVLHDRTLHDYPSYNSAYSNSRTAVERYLQQYPSIQVVLDLHRDAVELSDGSQYAPTIELDGQKCAQLMLLVGSNASGMLHTQWQENLAAALKMQIMLEKIAPGITRPTILRAQRYNHDLSAGAMIVEIGTAGNTLQEAVLATDILAQAIVALQNGSGVIADSTS